MNFKPYPGAVLNYIRVCFAGVLVMSRAPLPRQGPGTIS
jgi:hypothetical protein